MDMKASTQESLLLALAAMVGADTPAKRRAVLDLEKALRTEIDSRPDDLGTILGLDQENQ